MLVCVCGHQEHVLLVAKTEVKNTSTMADIAETEDRHMCILYTNDHIIFVCDLYSCVLTHQKVVARALPKRAQTHPFSHIASIPDANYQLQRTPSEYQCSCTVE